ncbi:MAG: class I SAM-dependent methyltransferase [Patescibacteria group bacterium]|nr:class I SAM-dependent methyltransferase [Patescibacteria group bacterium]
MVDIYKKEYFNNYYKNLKKNTNYEIKRNINWFWGWFKYLNRFIDLRDGKGSKVLEVGCAIGAFSSILYNHNFNVYASDFSKYILSVAKKEHPKIKFYNFDVQKEILINEKFNYIFSFEVLEHLHSPILALKNMYDKLLLNGILVCSTPPPYKKFVDINGHINVKSAQDWANILQKAGFQKNKIKIKQVLFLPFFYRYSKKFSFVIPIKINLPYFNSTYFIIAQK